MNNPEQYTRNNDVQRRDAKRFLDQYKSLLQWRIDGHDRLLDIGCGSGDVLMDIIRPMMPKDFEEIVGVDISPNMVNYARKAYAGTENGTEFQVLDVECESLPKQLRNRFDHVTSIYCLQWVQKLKKALENIYQLLRETGGDCLLISVALHPVYDVYKDSKWADYTQDSKKYIPICKWSTDPCGDFSAIMQNAGFENCYVTLLDDVYTYEGVENFRGFVKSVNPFISRIPSEQHADFLDDFVKLIEKMKLREYDEDVKDYKFVIPYKLLLAYGRRCGGSGKK